MTAHLLASQLESGRPEIAPKIKNHIQQFMKSGAHWKWAAGGGEISVFLSLGRKRAPRAEVAWPVLSF